MYNTSVMLDHFWYKEFSKKLFSSLQGFHLLENFLLSKGWPTVKRPLPLSVSVMFSPNLVMWHQIAHSGVLKDYRKALLKKSAENNIVYFWKSLNVKDVIYEYQTASNNTQETILQNK